MIIRRLKGVFFHRVSRKAVGTQRGISREAVWTQRGISREAAGTQGGKKNY